MFVCVSVCGGVSQTFLEILVLFSYNIHISQEKTAKNNELCPLMLMMVMTTDVIHQLSLTLILLDFYNT